MSWIVKNFIGVTTGSVNYVTNQILGIGGAAESNSNTTTRDNTTTTAVDLFEPVESNVLNNHHHNNNNNHNISTRTSDTDVERVAMTNRSESTPLLQSQRHATLSSSLTSTEYQSIEQSSQIVWLFILHAILYYTMAVIGFSYIVQDWSIIDSLYYATVLFCTIGFGDIEPNNWYAQLYTICLACYGIAFLGILLGNVIDYCLEYQHIQTEHNRRKVGTQVLVQLQEQHRYNNTTTTTTTTNNHTTNITNYENVNLRKSQQNTVVLDETIGPQPSPTNNATVSLLDEIIKLILFEIPVLTFAIGIAILIGHYEGWTVFQSIYWFVISGATVGFGDYYPQLTYIKLLCVIYLPFAVAVLGDLLGRIVTIYMDRKRRWAEQQFLARSLTMVDLDVMDVDQNGHVDKAEFLSYMLIALQKVSKDDIHEIMDLFHRLDTNNDNYLTKSDLNAKQWEQSFQTSIKQLMPPSSM